MHNFIAFKCSLFILKYGIKEAYWPVKCFNIFFSCSSQDRNPLQIPHDAFRACTWAGFLVWCRIHWISVCSETFSSQWFHTWVTSLSIKSVIQWSCLWFWNWNLYVRGIFFFMFFNPSFVTCAVSLCTGWPCGSLRPPPNPSLTGTRCAVCCSHLSLPRQGTQCQALHF